MVSIWCGQSPVEPDSDFLRDNYGIEYWDPDSQECVIDKSTPPISLLAKRLSYHESFYDALIRGAESLRLTKALWVLAQYDFAYDPARAGLTKIPDEPQFIGCFKWHE